MRNKKCGIKNEKGNTKQKNVEYPIFNVEVEYRMIVNQLCDLLVASLPLCLFKTKARRKDVC
jgi:hypothetical protein